MQHVAIHRETDPRSLNAIINDPDIAPHIAGGGHTAGVTYDLAPAVANPDNVNLIGEHGGMLAIMLSPGIYEIHTHVRREARGKWAAGMVRSALHHLFTRTGAAEILTKVPKGNLAARAMVRLFGGAYEFTAPAGWTTDGQPVPADVFSLTLQEWARKAPELAERGQRFYARVVEDLRAHGRDESYSAEGVAKLGADRAAGLALDMIVGEQYAKAAAFYLRWAKLAGAPPIEILHEGVPASVKFGNVLVVVRRNDIYVPFVQAEHQTPQ